MNIINMKSSEKEKSFQSVIKNKEIAFIIILSVIFLIFQISAGRIKNFEHRIFIIELFKMPYMFLLPFFMIRKEKPEKNQTLFYVISGLVLVLIAIVNKMGLSGVYYGHKYENFETVGMETLTAAVLYAYPIYYMVKKNISKDSVTYMLSGIIIGIILALNYISFNDIFKYNVYSGNNLYTYIVVVTMALYCGMASEFYYRVAVMDTFLKNGIKPIAAYVTASALNVIGIMVLEPIVSLNGVVLFTAIIFLFGMEMFFSFIYVKTNKSIIASGIAKSIVISVFYLSYLAV